jgi:hypothetical protein
MAKVKQIQNLCYAGVCTGQAPQSPSSPEPKISVRISTERIQFRPGEDIPLRVEIWNEGTKDFFIFKSIEGDVSNSLAKIDLTLYSGDQVDRPTVRLFADSFSSERSSHPPLQNELCKYWVSIPPQHFYGGEIVVRASWFKRLAVPGTYRIKGTYSSRGFLAQDINNPLVEYIQELKQLPYNAWVGEVETNSISIEIAKNGRRRSVK